MWGGGCGCGRVMRGWRGQEAAQEPGREGPSIGQRSGGEGRRLGPPPHPHPCWCYYPSPSGLQSPHLNPVPDTGAGQAEADPGEGGPGLRSLV